MKWMMRIAAVVAVALVCCGFGTYNREVDQAHVTPIAEGRYTFDGVLMANKKLQEYRVTLTAKGVYEIARKAKAPRRGYETIYWMKVYDVKGFPGGTYAMQYRGTYSAREAQPIYAPGIVKVTGGRVELFNFTGLKPEDFPPALLAMLEPKTLKDAKENFPLAMLELLKILPAKGMTGLYQGSLARLD